MNWYPGKAIIAFFYIILSLPAIILGNGNQLADSMEAQKSRMETLRAYYESGEYTPVDECAVTGFDINAAIADGVKFNELSFIGTHNSYQLAADENYAKVCRKLSDLTFGFLSARAGEYSNETLTEQFNCGIRSIELDIETRAAGDTVSFICTHEPGLNMNSTCADFALALEEIKLWSDNNPGHLPITIIIEPKKAFIPVNGTSFFNLDSALEFDELLRQALGDTLLTPAEMLGSYESFADMRENDGWLPLADTLGRVLVLLHDTTVTNAYISTDNSIKTQAMFPMLRYGDRNDSFASFLLLNEAEDARSRAPELISNKRFIIRTRADEFGKIDSGNRNDALESGSQIISTDYPPRTDGRFSDDALTFGGATVKSIK